MFEHYIQTTNTTLYIVYIILYCIVYLYKSRSTECQKTAITAFHIQVKAQATLTCELPCEIPTTIKMRPLNQQGCLSCRFIFTPRHECRIVYFRHWNAMEMKPKWPNNNVNCNKQFRGRRTYGWRFWHCSQLSSMKGQLIVVLFHKMVSL